MIQSTNVRQLATIQETMKGLIDDYNRLIGSNKIENGAIGADQLADDSVTALKISNSAIKLGYAETTDNQTSITDLVDLTNLAVTVTVPSSGRLVKITGFGLMTPAAAAYMELAILEGASVLQVSEFYGGGSGASQTLITQVILDPVAGSHTYKLQGFSTSSATLSASSSSPAFILVELI